MELDYRYEALRAALDWADDFEPYNPKTDDDVVVAAEKFLAFLVVNKAKT